MKHHVFRWLLSTGLVLGMLLPWVTTAPVSAAQATGAADTGTVLYTKTADEIYNAGTGHSSRDIQVTKQWSPNTEDTVNGTAGARKDIDYQSWSNILGVNEPESTGKLVRIVTRPMNASGEVITDYTDTSEFSYGLRPESDGTPDTLSLTMTMADNGKSALSLDTNEYGEMELTFQYACVGFSNPGIDLIENDFQVWVSTDGGDTWKDGYAGMKSHRIIAQGNLGESGTGSETKCYEVTSEDLTALAEGETINAILIRPFGSFDDFTAQYTYIRAISITGYETATPDVSTEFVHVDGDILRQIVAAHAKRLNSDTWVSSEDVKSNVKWADDGAITKAITYYNGVRYGGPVYSTKNASTYERFLSDIDENGNYTGVLVDEVYGDEGINGMDCLTVVYDCLSQVTSSRSLGGWYYLFYDLYDPETNPNGKGVPMYPAAERGGIERSNTDAYFDQLASTTSGSNTLYEAYESLKPGDFIYCHDHTRVITSPTKDGTVYVGETAGGTIEHYYERLSDGEVVSTTSTKYLQDPSAYEGVYANAHSGEKIKFLYSSSMRYDRPLATSSIYSGKYLPYTMREYTTGQVEKENVLITTNDPADFLTEGFRAAIDSNYIVRVLTVTLANNSYPGASDLYSKSVYGVQSDFSMLFADEELNAELECLLETPGKYELRVEVLSGPRIYLENGDVISDVADASDTVNPTTIFTYDFATQHTLTVGKVVNGSIELDKTDGKYGDTVTVTAVPAPGYALETIYVDGNPVEGNTFTIDGDNEVTAKFAPSACTISVGAVEHGAVSVDTDGGQRGDVVTVTAVPDAHYKLKYILVDGNPIAGNTFVIAGNHVVTAEFEPISYTVSVTGAQNGAVTVDKTSGIYGETVTVTVNPADGYMLSTVLVDGEAIPGTTFTITGNHTVSARFEKDMTTYTVKVVQPDNGTVNVNPINGTYGTQVTVTATPDEGYKLWAVQVDGAAIQGNTFTIRGNHTVTAIFVSEALELGEDETLPVAIPGPQKEEPEPVEPFSLYNANMELGNSLTMYFYFKQADIDPAKDYYVTITKTYADGRADVIKTIPEEDWIATTDADVPVYRVGFDGIAAKEMADDLKVQVFTADGNPASDLLTYNIRTYAMTMLEYFPSGELATLFVDMLNYGAASQTFFGYNTGDLANAQLTEEQQALATQSVEPVSNRVVGDMYYNVSLQLESEILLQMYFEGVTSDMYAKVTFTDHYGTQKSAVVPFEKFHHVSGTVYYIDVEGLAVADGRQLVTCELYNGNDELVGSGTDSVESYIATMNSVAPDALYTQIMKFIDSAYRYFH